jgi:O-antigen/teichoic acid export membrane protein
MSVLPEAGIGEEIEVPLSLWGRARTMVGERMTYALADQVVFSFGNMVVAALVARHSAVPDVVREFGMYILTQRAMDVAIQLCNVLLWGPFMFNSPGMAKERQSIFAGSVFLHQVVGCGLVAVAMFGASKWATTPQRGLYYGVFAPLVWTSAGILFREYTRRMYFAEMRMKEAFWTDVATNGLQILGVCWLWRVHRLNVTNTLWMLCAGAVVVSFWWLVREWRTFEVRIEESWQDLRLNLRLGRWFAGSNLVFMASSQCNPWVLSELLGGASVGAYSVCEQVVNIPRVALVSLQNIMAPMMARAYADHGKAALNKMVRRMNVTLFSGAAVFAVGIALLGPWVARLIFSGKTVPANGRLIMVLLAANLVAYASTMAQSYGLSAMGKADAPFYSNMVGLLAQVAVSLYLIRTMHVPGAGVAMLVGSIVVLGARQVYYLRAMQVTG